MISQQCLIHWGRVVHICIGNPTIIASSPSHYLNQCWNIVHWTLPNKLPGNLNQNSYIFIQENAFENVIRKMAAILSQPQCVKVMAWCHIGRLGGLLSFFMGEFSKSISHQCNYKATKPLGKAMKTHLWVTHFNITRIIYISATKVHNL